MWLIIKEQKSMLGKSKVHVREARLVVVFFLSIHIIWLDSPVRVDS